MKYCVCTGYLLITRLVLFRRIIGFASCLYCPFYIKVYFSLSSSMLYWGWSDRCWWTKLSPRASPQPWQQPYQGWYQIWFYSWFARCRSFKGICHFWEFSFYSKKGSLVMNITVFLLNKFIFILNFSFLMSSNLSLFPQTWGLSTENNLILDI